MISPGHLDLVAQRWTPFAHTIDFVGYDFSEATFLSQIRLSRDAPGLPLIELVGAAAPAEGISTTVAFDNGVPISTVEMRIDEATLETILLNTAPPELGKDVELVWDIHITGGGLPKTRWLEGAFVIRAGATQ